MTTSPVPSSRTPDSPSELIRVPGIAKVLAYASPVMLLVGGFFLRVSSGYTYDWAIFQTALGTFLVWVGGPGLMIAIVLFGVRSIAQQQLDILLQRERGHDEPARPGTGAL